MSIATEIGRIATAKNGIKTVINKDFNKITNEKIDQYANKIQATYDEYETYVPWEKAEIGTELTFTKGGDGSYLEGCIIKGNTEQATSILPSGYTQVEYLESTGTQYIDTGVNLSNNSNVEINAKLVATQRSKTYYLFGSSIENSRYMIAVSGYTNNYLVDLVSMDYRISSSFLAFDGDFHTHKITNLSYYIDGILQGSKSSSTFTNTSSAYIFDVRNRSTASNVGTQSWRVKYCKIWDGENLIRNFIPCTNPSNVAGMYDIVNGVFYTNAGTGTFNVGSVVSYPQDIRVVTGNNNVNVQGKNLFDKDNANIITAYIGENQNWVYSGSAICYRIKCKPNTSYTFSLLNTNETIFRGAVTDSEDIPTSEQSLSIYSVVRNTNNTPIIVNTTTNSKYILVQVSAAQYLTSLETLQIEEGSTATPYEPYQSQTYPINLGAMELCKIGDYQDYIYKDNGKWYKHSEIDKVVLDGSENWSIQSYNNQYYFRLATAIQNQINGYSNYFSFISYSQDIINYTNSIRINNSNIDVVLDKSAMTLADFKTWLSTHNTIVYYVLATPTTTEITDITLISQLNAIETLDTFENYTRINAETASTNLNPILDWTLFSGPAFQKWLNNPTINEEGE